MKIAVIQLHYVHISHTEFDPNLISDMPTKKLCLSLRRFSRNSRLINNLWWTSHVANFIKIERKLYKIRKIFYLRPPVQYSFYWTDFHETSCLKETHVDIVYLISPEWATKYEMYRQNSFTCLGKGWLSLGWFLTYLNNARRHIEMICISNSFKIDYRFSCWYYVTGKWPSNVPFFS